MNILKLPELLRHKEKVHDPAKVPAFHECGHGLAMVSFGLLPRYTSLIPHTGALGFNTNAFATPGYDLGIRWEEQGPECVLMHCFGGICGAAAYSGIYHWQMSAHDIRDAQNNILHYSLDFSEILRIWKATNEFVQQNYDLLEKAAERLYQDRVLGPEYWEEEVLLTT
jgi:hypothetical protein